MQTCHSNSFDISEVYISASHILTRSHMYKFNNKTYHYLVLSHTQFLDFNIETQHFSHIFHTHISSNEGDITCLRAFNVATFSINYLFCNFFGFDNSLIVICINSWIRTSRCILQFWHFYSSVWIPCWVLLLQHEACLFVSFLFSSPSVSSNEYVTIRRNSKFQK